MSFFTTLLAAGSLITLTLGAPVPSILSSFKGESITKRSADAYVMYTGKGATSSGWPEQSAWVSSFDSLFNANKKIMGATCAQWGVPNTSDAEINDIYNAIKTVASETSIDARYILAVMMQESGGCVRAPTTNWGVRNPGLMQDHNGAATCNENGVQNPCPAATITQMIRDGVAGTSYGDGLQQLISRSGASDVSKYYKAARMYNSGSIDGSGDLGAGIATHCYASDIANRLTGWVTAAHGCCLDGGNCAVSSGPVASDPVDTSTAPSGSSDPPPSESNSGSNSGSSSGSNAGSQTAPGASSQCTQWYTVQSGDYCQLVTDKFGITFDQFRNWNSGIDQGCSNLWLGYSYCVKA